MKLTQRYDLYNCKKKPNNKKNALIHKYVHERPNVGTQDQICKVEFVVNANWRRPLMLLHRVSESFFHTKQEGGGALDCGVIAMIWKDDSSSSLAAVVLIVLKWHCCRHPYQLQHNFSTSWLWTTFQKWLSSVQKNYKLKNPFKLWILTVN